MAKRMAQKGNDKQIIGAIAYVKEIRKQIPPDNQMIADHLDEWEKMLHEAHFNLAYQKAQKT
ncbi:MAG: hypothetical protein ABSB22_15260 [Thermodesulfobacteriota bacterium]|jgi:hypothetical protein